MRFMMIGKATKATEAGLPPTEKAIAAMMKYNEELQKAGVLLDLAGLQPSSAGARLTFSKGKVSVVDGPFTETKELIAGYTLIEVKDKAEAIEWAKRAPFGELGDEDFELELRPLYWVTDEPDVSEETKAAAARIGEIPSKK